MMRMWGVALSAALLVWAGTASAAGPQIATAALKTSDGADIGTVTLTEAPAGVLIKLELKGLPPGPHGLNVHETGKCEADFAGAGAVYNPLGAKHGFLNEEGPMAGNLPNVHAGADGAVTAELLSTHLTLSAEAEDGLFDADGASIVIYGLADDYVTEPDGNAGKRLACAPIVQK